MRFAKQYYHTAKERKINCYKVTISKETALKAGISEMDELEIIPSDGTITIKKRGKKHEND